MDPRLLLQCLVKAATVRAESAAVNNIQYKHLFVLYQPERLSVLLINHLKNSVHRNVLDSTTKIVYLYQLCHRLWGSVSHTSMSISSNIPHIICVNITNILITFVQKYYILCPLQTISNYVSNSGALVFCSI